MKAKLIVEGKEFEIEILDPELQKIVKPKHTGYEKTKEYWTDISGTGGGSKATDFGHYLGQTLYDAANYYSDRDICDNNIRADKLMRQLRRFAVEHRKEKLNWSDYDQHKYTIEFDVSDGTFSVDYWTSVREFGTLFFDSQETAQLAIDTFRDELIWYFTEYKDSL